MNARPEINSVLAFERPHARLWTYYLLRSLVIPPLFPVLAVYGWFRYHTLRYRFSNEGISMSWGLLFRREIIIQYSRIQDIHLQSNVVERWLGLARVQIQTASGNAGAEMTLEGFPEFEVIRDFLYHRMRGVQSDDKSRGGNAVAEAGVTADASLTEALWAVAEEVRALRLALNDPRTPPPSPHG